MSLDPIRLTEHVHGHIGWLAAAILLHPAIVLRNRTRRAHLAVGLAAAFVTVAGGLGCWLYVAYRDKLKQALFQTSPFVGLLMERKEHLAFGAVLLAWAGATAYFAAPRAEPETRALLRTIAYRAFAASAALAIVVAALGTFIAVTKTF